MSLILHRQLDDLIPELEYAADALTRTGVELLRGGEREAALRKRRAAQAVWRYLHTVRSVDPGEVDEQVVARTRMVLHAAHMGGWLSRSGLTGSAEDEDAAAGLVAMGVARMYDAGAGGIALMQLEPRDDEDWATP